ncbi:MAG: DUF2934 domain-containing protein [Opitutaceae bacterium]|nr:DUF2934 domain-containing protein [Opitutaceae bacterium]
MSTTSLSSNTDISADAISRRAYELWEQEGRPDGADLRHWLQAEKELSEGRSNPDQARASENAPRNGGVDRRSTGGPDIRPLQTARTTTPGRDTKRPPNSPVNSDKTSAGTAGQMAGVGRRK